jgi:HSP20 family protein
MEKDMQQRAMTTRQDNSGALWRPGSAVFGTLQREIDRLFEDFSRFGLTPQRTADLVPNIDVNETDQAFEITVEMPGLRREDVEISLDNDVLTIRGEKKFEAEKEDEKGRAHITERAYGTFFRAIQLPTHVDPSAVQATMADGVLKITIPKPAQSESRKIEVKEPNQQHQAQRGQQQGGEAGAKRGREAA